VPNLKAGERHPVALLTIASASHVVLLRLCKMRLSGRLPDALLEFLKDRDLHFLGTGWASDICELEHSYGIPREVNIRHKCKAKVPHNATLHILLHLIMTSLTHRGP
jgi:hypothetical protein